MLLEALGENQYVVDEIDAEAAEVVPSNDSGQNALKNRRRRLQAKREHFPLVMAALRDETEIFAVSKTN